MDILSSKFYITSNSLLPWPRTLADPLQVDPKVAWYPGGALGLKYPENFEKLCKISPFWKHFSQGRTGHSGVVAFVTWATCFGELVAYKIEWGKAKWDDSVRFATARLSSQSAPWFQSLSPSQTLKAPPPWTHWYLRYPQSYGIHCQNTLRLLPQFTILKTS